MAKWWPRAGWTRSARAPATRSSRTPSSASWAAQPTQAATSEGARMNLRGIWAVVGKGFRENLRDRRTLLSALVFGPVISAILVAVLVQFLISRTENQADQDIPLAVIHAEHAPNLVNYLAARGINIVKVEVDEAAARQA